jgi:uncharacterized protein (TIGR02646 family)
VIRLTKHDEPPELTANKAAWTAAYARDPSDRSYADPAIRDALRAETYGKCAYCESRMEHVSPSNIEHIRPKSLFPELVVDWFNLTLACTNCNTRKGTYYDAVCEIVNPYVDDPLDHVFWVGPLLLERTPDRGRITITRLDLNRAPLLFERAAQMRRVEQLLAMVDGLPEPAKAAIREDIAEAQHPSSEYSAAVAAFVEFRAA